MAASGGVRRHGLIWWHGHLRLDTDWRIACPNRSRPVAERKAVSAAALRTGHIPNSFGSASEIAGM